MLRPHSLPLIASLTLVVPLLASCGDTVDDAADTTLAPTTTAAPTTTTTTPIAPTNVPEHQAATVTGKDLVYATRDAGPLTLDMHVPAEPVGAPLVIYLPGGGQSQAPELMVDGLVENGVIVFVARYKPSGEGIAAILADRAIFRSMADSVGCAIHFARAQASELGSDDPVVALAGLSNGASLATHAALFGAELGARWDEFETTGGPARQVQCEATEGSTHVDALVGVAGPYDAYVPIIGGKWGSVYQQERDPELWEFLTSAIGTNQDLTIRLIHGETDRIVPYEASTLFAAALNDAGYNAGKVLAFKGEHVVPTDLAVDTITEAIKP